MCFFQAGNRSKGCVIHYNPYHRNFRFHGSGHYRHMAAESSIAHKRQNCAIGLRYFDSQGSCWTKPHGCQTTWSNKCSRNCDRKLLGYTIFIPTYICHKESIFRQCLSDFTQNSLWTQRILI